MNEKELNSEENYSYCLGEGGVPENRQSEGFKLSYEKWKQLTPQEKTDPVLIKARSNKNKR